MEDMTVDEMVKSIRNGNIWVAESEADKDYHFEVNYETVVFVSTETYSDPDEGEVTEVIRTVLDDSMVFMLQFLLSMREKAREKPFELNFDELLREIRAESQSDFS
jgi:hypothetical protein